MLSTRDMKRRARVQLHERMSDPVIYIETPASEHVGVLARLHLSFKEIGELLRGGFADRAEMTTPAVLGDEQVEDEDRERARRGEGQAEHQRLVQPTGRAGSVGAAPD